MIGWEDYTLVLSFVSKGFPYKDQIEELFIVNGLISCIPNTLHCQLSHSNFNFFYLQLIKGMILPICAIFLTNSSICLFVLTQHSVIQSIFGSDRTMHLHSVPNAQLVAGLQVTDEYNISIALSCVIAGKR